MSNMGLFNGSNGALIEMLASCPIMIKFGTQRKEMKEDTRMLKSQQLKVLISNLEHIRSLIAVGCSSDDALIKALERLQEIISDANSEVFSDEREILRALLDDSNNLHSRTITRAIFNERYAKHMKDLIEKLNAVEAAEAKAAKEAEVKATKETEANVDKSQRDKNRAELEEIKTMLWARMAKSTQLEKVIENLATARIEIAIGCQSEFTLCKSIKRLRLVLQNAVNSEIFSDEKAILMDILGNIHQLEMRDITRDIFGKYLDEQMNALASKNAIKEAEDKEDFKNKLMENIDLLYEGYKSLMQG